MHLWSKKMRKQQNMNISRLHDSNSNEPEQDLGDLKGILQKFQSSVHAAAERPDFFWRRQHNSIMAKLGAPASSPEYRRVLLWVPVAAVVVLCLFFFVENSKAPTPDLAAGSDQNLLIEVEQALDRDCPEALAPAALLSREIELADKHAGQPPASK